MSANQNFGTSFESQLRLEVSRILSDVIFVRSPVQARLLQFLLERSVSGDPLPTQYEIAVDALGRPDDYDLDSDSYPRVQISRLRKNLENYYKRNLPGNERKVVIEKGQYRLTLARPEAGLSENEPHEVEDEWLQQGEPVQSYYSEAFVLGAILIIVFASGIYAWSQLVSGEPEPIDKPTIVFELDKGPSIEGLSDQQQLVENTRSIVERQLSNSFVSKLFDGGKGEEAFRYRFQVSFRRESPENVSAFVALKDRENELIYSGDVEYVASNPSQFYNELEGILLYLTSPSGVIAIEELQDADNAASSDYLCFLRIESQRAQPGVRRSSIDRCLQEFPDSDYAAFWFARRSYERYQAEISGGELPARDGEAWADLQSALAIDPSNAFATFLAAKVELAQGNCQAADSYLRRSYSRASSYPTLLTFMEADASSCSAGIVGDDEPIAQIARVIERNPDPDPFLHLHLTIAGIAGGDLETARTIASRRVLSRPTGVVQETSHLLRRFLMEGKLSQSEKLKLQENIELFVWSEKARQKIAMALEQGATTGA